MIGSLFFCIGEKRAEIYAHTERPEELATHFLSWIKSLKNPPADGIALEHDFHCVDGCKAHICLSWGDKGDVALLYDAASKEKTVADLMANLLNQLVASPEMLLCACNSHRKPGRSN